MRLTLAWFGYELDFSLGPTTVDDEAEPVTVRGDSVSIPIGYAPSPPPEWEKPLNRYDEPSEADEDV